MSIFPQCHRQSEDLRRHFGISAISVNEHPAIVDLFRKFYENGPCIQTISFRVTMLQFLKKSTPEVSKGVLKHLLLSTLFKFQGRSFLRLASDFDCTRSHEYNHEILSVQIYSFQDIHVRHSFI